VSGTFGCPVMVLGVVAASWTTHGIVWLGLGLDGWLGFCWCNGWRFRLSVALRGVHGGKGGRGGCVTWSVMWGCDESPPGLILAN
jgi:hypothetical protein